MLIKPNSKFEKGSIIISDGRVAIFESLGHHPDGGSFNDDSYFFVQAWSWLDDPDDYVTYDDCVCNINSRQAKKVERDLLLAKMALEGYYLDRIHKVVKHV